MRYVKIRKIIDIRKNTWYNKSMIRKGDTYDANDAERDDKTSQKETGLRKSEQNGSHITMRNQTTGRSVVVPYHSKAMKKGLEQAILKQAGAKISPAPEI